MILAQTIVLLDRDRQKTRLMIQEHRVQALQQFKIVFKMIKIVEQTYFKNENFFHVENQIKQVDFSCSFTISTDVDFQDEI